MLVPCGVKPKAGVNWGWREGVQEGFLGKVLLKLSLKAMCNSVEFRYTKNIPAA